jgi:uncharacterized membrane protein
METLTIAAVTFFIFCVMVLALIMTSVYCKTKKQSNQLWNVYQKALQGGDKEAAMKAGMEYCGLLSGGMPKGFDMQSVETDIAAMDSKVYAAPSKQKAESSELFWLKEKLEKGTITSDEFSKLKNALVITLS